MPRLGDVFSARYDDGRQTVRTNIMERYVGDVRGPDVLDVGGGIGYLAARCAGRGPRVLACDLAEAMLQCTRERHGSVFPCRR